MNSIFDVIAAKKQHSQVDQSSLISLAILSFNIRKYKYLSLCAQEVLESF